MQDAIARAQTMGNQQHGQTVGNRVWDATKNAWQDIGNPQDPSQLMNWSVESSGANANRPLWDSQTLEQLQTLFAPLYKQQRENYTQGFNQALNSGIGQATNQAGAMAAFRGLNPASYTQSAAQRVRSGMTPQYFSGLSDLLQGQTQNTLNATAQSNQFKSGNAAQYAQMLMNASQQAQQQWNQPGFWDYLLGGLFGSLGDLGGAAINKWG